MGQPLVLVVFSLLSGITTSACGKKQELPEISVRSGASAMLLPAHADAPEFVRSLSLLYPHAEIFRVDNRIVQKTPEPLPDVVQYYRKTLVKHGFEESTKLEQTGGAFLEYERMAENLRERISIDIQKLPYAENYLIHIARAEVQPLGQ